MKIDSYHDRMGERAITFDDVVDEDDGVFE